MFDHNKLDKYADVLLWGLKTARKGVLKKEDIILLQYEFPALPLAEILHEKILDLGAYPVLRVAATARIEHSFYRKANEKQLTFITPGDKELYGHIQGRIFLRAPESLTHLKDIDPKKIGSVLVSRKPLRELLDRREANREYSWTLCTYPTPELAKQARMTEKQYTDQIIRGCFLDTPDPVGRWNEVYKTVSEIKKWLNSLKVKAFQIASDNVDLLITPGERRKWAGVSGHNIPSFEVFLSPDWRGTEGTYFSNLPSFRSGNYVEGVRLKFEKGRVVETLTESGEEFTKKQLSMDEGACRVGEFSLTDRRFSRISKFMADTLFDENFGGKQGNCHVALGSSYADTYNGNPAEIKGAKKKALGFNDSALHWDLVNTEKKTVTAHLTNGKKLVVYHNGIFTY
ncbi:MAG TPA: aminopeptidase [Syntrophorhabdaceae bacterium]|nr:aminopeptidase [Syntrophorhabdaceae bacterium]